MGKRGGAKRAPNTSPWAHKPLSLREEKLGKKQTQTTNVKSKLKLEHLQNLAVWASGQGSVPSLAAFFGHRLAAENESQGLQPNPSFFSCERCETILQPGFNCTIRIEKNHVKAWHKHKKSRISTQNNVVYKCHFCSHRNLKRGTPEGHMKDIYPPKTKPSLKQEHAESTLLKFTSLEKDTRKYEVSRMVEIPLPTIVGDSPISNSPVTPTVRTGITFDAESTLLKFTSLEKDTGKYEVSKVDEIPLPTIVGDSPISNSPVTPTVRTRITLDVNQRKRNRSGTKKPAESEINSAATNEEKTESASTKRKRKAWTSLKEIAERSEQDNS